MDKTIAGAFSGENALASPKGSLSQAKGQKGNKASYFLAYKLACCRILTNLCQCSSTTLTCYSFLLFLRLMRLVLFATSLFCFLRGFDYGYV